MESRHRRAGGFEARRERLAQSPTASHSGRARRGPAKTRAVDRSSQRRPWGPSASRGFVPSPRGRARAWVAVYLHSHRYEKLTFTMGKEHLA